VAGLNLRQTRPGRIRVQWDTPHDGGTVNNCEVVVTRGGEQLSKRRPGAKKLHVVIRKLEPGTTNTNITDTANSSTITSIRKLEPGTTNTNTAGTTNAN